MPPSNKRLNDLLLSADFSNEIDDLPPPGTFIGKKFQTPKEIQKELDRARETKEAEFRRWLIKNKPHNALMTPIETSTVAGVPDIYCCYNSFSSWIECKVLVMGSVRFRGTQYSYLKKLITAGGNAKIVVQRLNKTSYKPASISIYDAAKIVTMPFGLFKKVGQDLIFPVGTEPDYTWSYTKDKDKLPDLYQRLLLDTEDFTW